MHAAVPGGVLTDRPALCARHVALVQEVARQLVRQCRIYGGGVVVLTEENKLYSMTNFEHISVRPLCSLPDPTQLPSAWMVVNPQLSLRHNLEVWMSVNGSVYVVTAAEAVDLRLRLGPLSHMAISPNGTLLALMDASGRLSIISSDLQRNLVMHEFQTQTPPTQMVWCGTESVIVRWDSTLFIVPLRARPIEYQYDEPVVLVAEVDGARAIGNTHHDFIERVPGTCAGQPVARALR